MTDISLDRYSRQMRFYGIGEAGQRKSMLAPLAEIAAEWVDPVTRITVATLLDRLA